MLEGCTCVYKSISDVLVCVVGAADENEVLLASILATLVDALGALFRLRCVLLSATRATSVLTLRFRRNQVDAASLLAHYDALVLALDQLLDDG